MLIFNIQEMKRNVNLWAILLLVFTVACSSNKSGNDLPEVVKLKSELVKNDGSYSYRDLNKNGKLDIYEDSRQSTEERILDLLGQMTLEEKAGMMFYPPIQVNRDGTIEEQSSNDMLSSISFVGVNEMKNNNITHFNLFTVYSPDTLAMWYNKLQKFAEKTRLGIPVTIASDPRNQAAGGFFSQSAKSYSAWPDPLGLAAIGDEALVEKFADISRQEYVSTGIRQALHPQVDLATEPRWSRISGSFGEDAELTAKLAKAYIRGYQGATLGETSVACMTKHFPGGGPQKEGLDPHFEFQKGQVYPGNNFDYHLIPFEAAFEANTAAIMPYYGVPMGQEGVEEVGFSYNKAIIKDLLRGKYKYDGVVCTDWSLVTDVKWGTLPVKAKAWGVENLTGEERVQKLIDAGVDQLGGEILTEIIVKLVKKGKITESRIDTSVVRLLRLKFQLGLFDNPFVDEQKTSEVIGNPEFIKAGGEAQRMAMTLLKNEDRVLPLSLNELKIYIKNINPQLAANYGTIVDNPEDADIALIRLQTPNYQIPEIKDNLLATMFHFGDMDFKGNELEDILTLEKTVPTVVDIYIDRPAVIPDIAAASKALFASFGSDDAAFLDVVFGKYMPEGHLPIELPSSMEAVRNQKEDLPYDSENPLFPFGAGLSY